MRHLLTQTAVAAIAICISVAACSTNEPSTSADATDVEVSGTNVAAGASDSGSAAPPTTEAAPTTTASQPTTTPTTTAPASSTDAPSTLPATTIAHTSQAPPSTSTSSTADCVAALDRRDRVALLVWPAVYSQAWDEAQRIVSEQRVGGVILMKPSGWDEATLTARLAELDAASAHGLIIATDEEGGDVQRLDLLGPLPSQRTVSQTLTADQAEDLIESHGQRVARTGVDMVLGPVVDVEPNVGDVPLQPSRIFTGPPDAVSAFGGAYVHGWDRAGLMSVLKHYPGHGAASGDTHITAGVTPSLDDLEAWDLKPYADLADPTGAVMVGHLTVPGLTDGVPATRSAAAVDYLRTTLAWGDALLITDALGMDAVGLPEPEAAVLALEAGIDVVIFTRTSQTESVIDAIGQAVADGRISDEFVTAAATKVLDRIPATNGTC